jgi:hypothetical protein
MPTAPDLATWLAVDDAVLSAAAAILAGIPAQIFTRYSREKKAFPRVEVLTVDQGEASNQMIIVPGGRQVFCHHRVLLRLEVVTRRDQGGDQAALVRQVRARFHRSVEAFDADNLPYHEVLDLSVGTTVHAVDDDDSEDSTTLDFTLDIGLPLATYPAS